MKDNIIFFQSTNIGGTDVNDPGLFELFISNLENTQSDIGIFEQIQVVVPNQAMAIWLRDQITLKCGICANLDFVALPGPVLNKIFLDNNPDTEIFDFIRAKYIIYQYLCATKLDTIDAKEINGYIYKDGVIDKLRVYQLSIQLQQIFHEYIYLRTNDLINLISKNLGSLNHKIPAWQKQIIKYLFKQIGDKKTFLDVYQYFADLDLEQSNLKLPKRLFIFGLTSVYPSQLQIIKKLSNRLDVYWYYKTCSFEYYADLLSIKARAKLEKKVLKYPELNLDDLYLTDGNPLLANLGQQSREFIELLRANDIEVYDFNVNVAGDDAANSSESSNQKQPTFLSILQHDVQAIKYRISQHSRLSVDSQCYIDPVQIVKSANESGKIYDLANNRTSIKVNVCHNKMREVQVMFNEVAMLLDKNSQARLDEILITAPDIDDYAPYIKSVFANEFVQKEDGVAYKIHCNVTGDRRYSDYKILETLKIILNAPYNLPVNYFLEILTQAELQHNLDISITDIDLVKKWLAENRTYFGYSAFDYEQYGYENYSTHSFKQFLNNLVLGACLTDEILLGDNGSLVYNSPNSKHKNSESMDPSLPHACVCSDDRGIGHCDDAKHSWQSIDSSALCPYDNVDSSQIELCNKLINLIEQLEKLRQIFYLDANTYKELTVTELHETLSHLQDYLVCDDKALLISQNFLGELLSIEAEQSDNMSITLPIFNLILDEYIGEFKSTINLNGAINCVSMQYVRNLPYKYIYVLGMNFAEFPRIYQPNRLSILAHEWYLADRNYNIEDKQTFLDIVLSAKEQLFISYIGHKETDNSEIKPSTILSLFLTTIAQSFSDFWLNDDGASREIDYKNIVVHQALHPFYNNPQDGLSKLWHDISKITGDDFIDKRWDFRGLSKVELSNQQKEYCYNPNIRQLVNSFLYTNSNLYKTLGINVFPDAGALPDLESFKLHDLRLAKTLYNYFEKYQDKMQVADLCEYLLTKGVIGYNHVGRHQFKYYYDLYQFYRVKRGNKLIEVLRSYSFANVANQAQNIEKENVRENLVAINIKDHLYLEGDKVIIVDAFENITNKKLAKNINELPYSLKMQGIITYLLLQNSAEIRQVILRQINADQECCDFNIEIADINLWDDILKHYLDSFIRPVLIHKAAIEEYAKTINMQYGKTGYKDFDLNVMKDQASIKAKSTYMLEYNNYDLEKIKEDLLFAPIATDYFNFIQKSGLINDIVTIGEILSKLKLAEKIKLL